MVSGSRQEYAGAVFSRHALCIDVASLSAVHHVTSIASGTSGLWAISRLQNGTEIVW